MKILVTGANGFVGEALCRRLSGKADVVAATRARTGEIGPETDWRPLLAGVDAVVHLAARVHVLKESAADPLAEFRRVNAAGTRALARQAAAAGAKRFVYLSTIGAHGDRTAPGAAIAESSPIRPHNDYSLSKHEGETALREEAGRMEPVVLRAPLIYGRGAGGNFGRLLKIVRRGIPLPLAAVRNARSLLYLENLLDVVESCLDVPAAAGQDFTLADGDDLSTPDLLRGLGEAAGRPARLFPFPLGALRLAAAASGRRRQFEQLTSSLVVDASKARAVLGWSPRYSARDGLRASVL